MALQTILRTPTSLRPLLLSQSRHALYHSYETPLEPPYPEPELRILSAALAHVPAHGFRSDTIARGARDAGYLDISTNLFPKGAFELVRYHLVSQRLALANRVQFREEELRSGAGVGRRVRALVLARLHANAEAGVVGRWQEALGLMSLAENIPESLRELARLSDEIWFLAGDTAVDGSWYTKRASLSAIYAAAEVFQTTDQSSDFHDTEQFLDRRLEDLRIVGTAVGGTMQWLGHQGGAVVNLLRSKGVRI